MYKPKGKRGAVAVKRLGRRKKTGEFNKISKKAAKRYGSKAAGKRVAGSVYWKQVQAKKRKK